MSAQFGRGPHHGYDDKRTLLRCAFEHIDVKEVHMYGDVAKRLHEIILTGFTRLRIPLVPVQGTIANVSRYTPELAFYDGHEAKNIKIIRER